MADLIDRQKIKARFEPWLKVKGYSEGELNMLKAVLYEITIMPSAERHGHWIPVTNGRGGHECDICHNYASAWQTGEERLTNYCPNCGARMDGE